MTTEQIKMLRAKYLPGNFAQYRAELREEARRLGHKVGANDIISLLEAHANDENRIVTDDAGARTDLRTGRRDTSGDAPPEKPSSGLGGSDTPSGEGEGNPDTPVETDDKGDTPSGDGGEEAPKSDSPRQGGGEGGQGGGGGAPTDPDTGKPVPKEPQPMPYPDEQGKPTPTPDGKEQDGGKAREDLWKDLFGDDGDSEMRQKEDELAKRAREAEEAEREVRRKQEEAEKLRKELAELRRKQEEARKKREEEERRKREEEEMKNLKHYKTDDLLQTLRVTGIAYLVGPAGTGKSTLAMDAAVELYKVPKDDFKFNEHFAQISFSPDTTSAEMVGRCDINGVFHRSEVVRVFAEGGLILFDEIDNADASMLVKLNTAIANGTFATPEGLIRRHKDTVIVCTANTYGTGPDAMYVGRSRLDAATLDRFVCSTIEVDYDVKLEAKIANILPKPQREWVQGFVKRVRDGIKANRFRRICSTRFVVNAVRWLLNGATDRFVKDRFTVGWTDAEKQGISTALNFNMKA